MKLPNAEKAFVDAAKLRGYCLNPDHETGKHKARVFQAALGIGAEDARWLRVRLLEAVQKHDATLGPKDAFGQHYIVDFPLEGLSNEVIVRSCWLIRHEEDFPRLTTCFVL